jgi:hypothetical protein
MAININESLKAEHICIVADTGGGKTAAAKLLDCVKQKTAELIGDHVAIFDIYNNYRFDGRKAKNNKFNGLGGRQVFTYHNRKDFAKNFIAAWRSGKRFVVAYNPIPEKPLSQDELLKFRRAELDWFGSLMWQSLDGNRKLHILVEELAKLVQSVGKDSSIIGEIATGGRAYGGVLVTLFQRKQEVPKTIWNMSPTKIIGALENHGDIKAMSEATDAPIKHIEQVSKLNAANEDEYLHYIIKRKGFGNLSAKRVKLKPPFKVDNWSLEQLLAA